MDSIDLLHTDFDTARRRSSVSTSCSRELETNDNLVGSDRGIFPSGFKELSFPGLPATFFKVCLGGLEDFFIL